MAKVTITISDNPDGSVDMTADCDPPMDNPVEHTGAQAVAAALLQAVLDDAEADDSIINNISMEQN